MSDVDEPAAYGPTADGPAADEPTLWLPTGDTPTSYVRPDPAQDAALDHPPYKSTQLRHPKQPLIRLPQGLTEITGPQLGATRVVPGDADLTAQHEGEPIGERILVLGRVMDTEGKPLRGTLVEIWQANAGGRYRHAWGAWPAPLDPSFSGAGRCVTDDEGRFRFVTIKPGPYPWGNHHNAWRPAHIHVSLLGRAFAQRLVTQMYFPDDPFLPYDPILQGVRDPAARERMLARFSVHDCVPNWAPAYTFDVVLRGPGAVPFEEAHG